MNRTNTFLLGLQIVCGLARPAAAHMIDPNFMEMAPGTQNDIHVRDASCAALVKIFSPAPAIVRVYALDPTSGMVLPGDGQFAQLEHATDAVFRVIVPADAPSFGSVPVKVCWDGDAPCTDDLCSGFPGTGIPVTVIVRPERTTDEALWSSTTIADPVNSATREFFLPPRSALRVGGRSDLGFDIYYASRLVAEGGSSPLGAGWRHNFYWQFRKFGAAVSVHTPLGREIRFEKLFPATTWTLTPYGDIPFQLVEDGADFVLGDPRDGKTYRYAGATSRLLAVSDQHGNQLTLTYDGSGRIVQVADPDGHALSIVYTSGRLTSVSSGGRTVSFTHDATSQLLSMTDALGNVTAYAYQAAATGYLKSVTLPEGNARTTQVYDAQRRVISQTDALGNTTTIAADDLTGETTITDPFGQTTVHTYTDALELVGLRDELGATATLEADGAGRHDRLVDKRGDATDWTYDAVGGELASVNHADGGMTTLGYTTRQLGGIAWRDLTSVVQADGASRTFTYDAEGTLVTATDPAGGVNSFTSSGAGQVLTATNPAGGVTSYAYDAAGNVSSATDPSGNTTTYGYDAFERPVLTSLPDASTVGFAWDARDRLVSTTGELGGIDASAFDGNGNLVSSTSPLGRTWTYTYDAMDRIVSGMDPAGHTTTFGYDALGRRTSTTDGGGRTFTTSYDAAGRAVSMADPGGNLWSSSFDAEDILASTTNPLGATWTVASDAMGRPVQVTDPTGATSQSAYDAMGRLAQTTGPLGGVTSYSRDARGLVTQVSLPLPGIGTSYTYDALGDLTGTTDPRGNLWSNAYDNQERRIARTDPDGSQWAYAYDSRNRITQMTLPGTLGSASSSYDPRGRLTQTSFTDGTMLQFAYDADDRPISATSASAALGGAQTSTLVWDGAGRIVESNGLAMTYDGSGLMTSVTLAPGRTVAYAYDARGYVTGVSDWLGGATTLSYDAAGRLTSVARPNGIATTYTYDAADRVVAIQEGALASISLTRDARGQIVSASRDLPLVAAPAARDDSYDYDPACRVEAFPYDPAGRPAGDGARTYTWDLASRMRSYTAGASTVYFEHDAFSHVVSRSEGGEIRGFAWNYALGLPSVMVERDLSSPVAGTSDLRYFVLTPEGMLLYHVEATGGARQFFHYDEMGNTVFLTDDLGAVVASYAYTPYGEIVAESGAAENRFTFQGRFGVMRDGGLFLHRARFYDPGMGRFLSPDPVEGVGPKGINPYHAFRENPLLYVDPRGTDGEEQEGSYNPIVWIGWGLRYLGRVITREDAKAERMAEEHKKSMEDWDRRARERYEKEMERQRKLREAAAWAAGEESQKTPPQCLERGGPPWNYPGCSCAACEADDTRLRNRARIYNRAQLHNRGLMLDDVQPSYATTYPVPGPFQDSRSQSWNSWGGGSMQNGGGTSPGSPSLPPSSSPDATQPGTDDPLWGPWNDTDTYENYGPFDDRSRRDDDPFDRSWRREVR